MHGALAANAFDDCKTVLGKAKGGFGEARIGDFGLGQRARAGRRQTGLVDQRAEIGPGGEAGFELGLKFGCRQGHLLDGAPWDAIEQYQAFCDERGVTMLAATFAWLLAQPGLTSVIAGATRPEQIVANAEAATSWSPTADELETISGFFPPAAS